MASKLLTVAEWVATRPDLYAAGAAGFDWRWRTRKRQYVESGAVLVVGGQRMIDPAVCERVELAIARDEALALLDRSEAT